VSYEERVLISAPFSNDARLTAEFLSKAGFQTQICPSLSDLSLKIDEGCAMILIAEDALMGEGTSVLTARLARQPSWSDIPLTIITKSGDVTEARLRVLNSLGNVSLIERPFRPGTLLSNVEVALRSRRRQYEVRDLVLEREAMVASIRDAFATFDHEWRCTFLNEQAAFLAGRPREMNFGRSLWDFFPGLGESELQGRLRNAVEAGRQFEYACLHDRLNRWLEIRIYPSARGVSLFATDITDRKQAEEALRESEERFRTMADGLPLIVWVHDAEGNQQFVNRTFCEFFGVTQEQMRDVEWKLLMHPEDAEAYISEFSRCVRELRPFHAEVRVRNSEGQWCQIESWGRPRFSSSGELLGFVGASADITERKAAEASLRRQFELTEAIANNSSQAIFMLDAEGCCTFLNPAAEQMFGFTFGEVQGQLLHDVVHHHHPDGRPFPMVECPIGQSLQKSQAVRGHEDIFIRKNGDYFPVLVAASPVFEDGKVVSTILEVMEITERKRAEDALHRAQAALQAQNEALESTVQQRTARLTEMIHELELLSYSIVHDMRAPLRAMNGYASVLLEDHGHQLGADGREYLQRIITAAVRQDQFIKDVLDYTSVLRQAPPLRAVDLDELLSEILRQYPDLNEHVSCIHVESPLGCVLGHEALLTQCLSNLLNNALKFTHPARPPRVTVRTQRGNGGTIRLSVEDNGIGIPAEDQQRVFEIFHRLHRSRDYEGTGIGLSIVRKVVERMGGKAGVESVLGEGSRFWVELLAPGIAR
jgi:PAS domain S-box-containing protein